MENIPKSISFYAKVREVIRINKNGREAIQRTITIPKLIGDQIKHNPDLAYDIVKITIEV